jgi:hypothetical protein
VAARHRDAFAVLAITVSFAAGRLRTALTLPVLDTVRAVILLRNASLSNSFEERTDFVADWTVWKNTSRLTTGIGLMFRTMSISDRIVTARKYRSERKASKSSGTEDTAAATYPFSFNFETMSQAASFGRKTRIGFC